MTALPPELNPRGPVRPSPAHRRRRILGVVAAVVSVAVLGVSTAGYAVVNHYDGNVERIKDVFDALPGRSQPPPAPRDAVNYLIVGSDSREGLAEGEGVQGTGSDFVVGQRSDTVILAHLYGGDANQAKLVSFPRDSLVTVPEHVDLQTGKTVPERLNKLNSAFADGGPRLLRETVEGLTGIRVDHYLQVDFDGFKGMVDGLGGVEICLSRPAQDRLSGIDLQAGRQTIGGTNALAFVRQRKGLPGGDLDRIQRQQQFLGSMIRKLLSADTLANPVKLSRFLKVATDSLQVDEELELEDLAGRMQGLDAGGVQFTTVPIKGIEERGGRLGSVVALDEGKGEELFGALRRDEPSGAASPPAGAAPTQAAEPLTIAPGSIRVRVYNGSGVAGLGRKNAADLSEIGFQVVGTPTNRGADARDTVVRHGPTRADSARTVAAAIPGSRIEPDPALDKRIEVVVGSSYTGARPVKVTGSARPTPSTPASAPPKVLTAAEDLCGR